MSAEIRESHMGLGVPLMWIPALSLYNCTPLGKQLNLSPHLSNGDSN